MLLHSLFGRPVCCFRAVVTMACLAFASAVYAKPAWRPVTPEELGEKSPRISPDAPAEVLFYEVTVDDSQFPQNRRAKHYVRYKVYTPDRAIETTRMSVQETKYFASNVELYGRLTLPDGTVKEFGKEAVRERTMAKQARGSGLGGLLPTGENMREKFLVIAGVEPGSVVEFYRVDYAGFAPPFSVYVMQPGGCPTRQAEFVCSFNDDSDIISQAFALNLGDGKLTEDKKKHTVRVTAQNLPGIESEPYSVAEADRTMTVVTCYESTTGYLSTRSGMVDPPDRVDGKSAPWAFYATVLNFRSRDFGYVTKRAKALAQELTAAQKTPAEKATVIHRYVRELRQKYRSAPAPGDYSVPAMSVDDVLDLQAKPQVRRPDLEFLWLAIALYRAAGLEAEAVLLPDSDLMRFDPRMVSWLFLPHAAAVVKIDGTWTFSAPQLEEPLPFGLLPPNMQGQHGLLGLNLKQEFVSVPFPAPDKSAIVTSGALEVDRLGTLRGELKRLFTGHQAMRVRRKLEPISDFDARAKEAAAEFGFDAGSAEVTVTAIAGLDDCEVPLELKATVTWPGFATVTKDRLIIRSATMHATEVPPFVSQVRHGTVRFPFPWKSLDRYTIQVPEGFAPEAPSAPGTIDGGAIQYKLEIGYERERRRLHVRREMTSGLVEVAQGNYPQLKLWYESVARADQHEIVFTSHTPSNSTAAEKR